jgi:flavin reductase (DIM6/NTAB) family NADH-FMN oxidoreductase RutF
MIDSDTFRAALGRFSCGITILTACDQKGRDHGMTVSAFCSVSLEPPLVLVCVGHDASMHGLMMRAENVGLSVLSSAQEPLSRRFADPESDRFDGIGYSRGEKGIALLDDALVHLECNVVDRHEAGDHTIVICAVERAEAFDGRPLLYYRGGYAQLER